MDRVTPPPFKKSLSFELPSPERYSISASTELIYLPSSLSQAVKIEFVFKAGRIYESTLGVAQFTAQLLDKGVPGKNANQIAALLDYYGAHLESNTGFDFISVSLYCLKKDVKHLLPLFISLLTEASFPEDELEKYRKIFTENLKINLQKNSFLASNEIRKSLFGGHPYGLSISIENAQEINIHQVKSYFNTHFLPNKIFVVGTLEENDLSVLLKFNYSISSSKTNLAIPIEERQGTRRDINGPNKTQASLRLGKQTIARTHPDIPGLTLVNHILGGFFGSRLMKNIREEKGLTYGIHSGIQHLNHASWLTISADVNTEKVEEALTEIRKEIYALLEFNNSEELELCKNHLIGSLQNDTATIFSVGERIKTISLNELGQDYYQTLINGVSIMTIADIVRLTQSHLSDLKLFEIVVK